MAKIYLTAGHEIVNGKGTGAHSSYGDEALLAQKVVSDLTRVLSVEYMLYVVNDSNTWKLAETIQWLKGIVSEKDFIIDVHFNAGPDAATGVEVIVPDCASSREVTLADNLAQSISRSLGIRNRGVKKEKDTARKTIGILRYPAKATNVLIEVCFLTNRNDMSAFNSNYDSFIKSLAYVINKSFKNEVLENIS